MAKAEKQSFILYHSIRKPLELLDDEQAGKLLKAILNYSEYGEEPETEDGMISMAFAFIRNSLDKDTEAWEEKSQRRAEAGSKGGKQTQANASKAKQNEAMFETGKQNEQTQANQAVSVSASVSVTDNVSVLEEKSEKEKAPAPRIEARGKKPPTGVKEMKPPTREEVRAYCQERKSSVDPDRFYDYFDVGHWKDAKGQPVLNWKQKLLTWEKHDPGKNPQQTDSGPVDLTDLKSMVKKKPNQITGSAVVHHKPDTIKAFMDFVEGTG